MEIGFLHFYISLHELFYKYSEIIFFLGFVYKTFLENKAETCEKSDDNRIYSKGFFSREECEGKCDISNDCMYIGYFPSGWCTLYKSCTKLRRTKKESSTFEKVIDGKINICSIDL